MNNIFGSKIKILREIAFPGISLRKVGDKFKINNNFYSYLSKIEQGTSLPSENLLDDIRRTYNLSESEYEDIVNAYMQDKVIRSLENLTIEINKAPTAVRQFLRTTRNKTEEDESNSTQKF